MKPAEIDAAFGDGSLFQQSAYRLERLDEYDAPETRERMRRWRAGQPQGADIRAYWDAVVGDARRAGKSMRRVHWVSEPVTDYLRFEFDFYRGSVAAGEEIRILPARLSTGVELPEFDYWLFDDERAAVMYYGDRGAWLRTEIVTDPAFIEACCHWRDSAWSAALPLDAYLAERSAH
jgi:hypothetical protein